MTTTYLSVLSAHVLINPQSARMAPSVHAAGLLRVANNACQIIANLGH